MILDDAALLLFEDRRCIRDCVSAYAHAVDRHDDGRIAAVFHPDATDDHGRYVGGVPGFVAWVNGVHEANEEGHAHNVTTHCCEVDGDTAHAESYVLWVLRHRGGRGVLFGSGRYVDRLERRDSRWRISLRRVIREIRFECAAGPMSELALSFPTGRWDRRDLAYALEEGTPVSKPNRTPETGSALLRQAIDRQAVRDCISRAARAVDRADMALLAEVAYPEAAGELVSESPAWLAHTHNVTTHVARLGDHSADAFSQLLVLISHEGMVTVESRRLHDRLCRVGASWRIVSRQSSTLWMRHAPAIPLNPDDGPQTSWRDRRDISYQRPLSM